MKGTGIVVLLLLAATCGLSYGRQGFGKGGQEWGYVDVRKGAHMFYWLYYVNGGNDIAGKPLVIWLQGGPGASSTSYGNFEEMGPLDLNLTPRQKSWANHVNLMFVDNPVGTGFSYVDNRRYLSRDNQQIAADLVQMYLGFLEQNPQFRAVPLYIFCESYGGKMTPEFAYELYKVKQQTNNTDINIKGLGLGDGWISGVDSTITWAPYLQEYGLVDDQQFAIVDSAAQKCRKAVEAGRWADATNQWSNTEQVISDTVPNFTDDNFYNIYGGKLRPDAQKSKTPAAVAPTRKSALPISLRKYAIHAQTPSVSSIMRQVRRALGLPWWVRHQAQSDQVFDALNVDFMKPVTNIVEKLLSETPIEVNVYNGEWDLIVDYLGTLDWVNRLKWSGADKWKAAAKVPFMVNNVNNGYVQSYGNFKYYSIARAGHMVPSDNPDACLTMLRRIVHLDDTPSSHLPVHSAVQT